MFSKEGLSITCLCLARTRRKVAKPYKEALIAFKFFLFFFFFFCFLSSPTPAELLALFFLGKRARRRDIKHSPRLSAPAYEVSVRETRAMLLHKGRLSFLETLPELQGRGIPRWVGAVMMKPV